jgi:bacillithiol biosynthesis deacetylase BshB1
MKVEILAIGAHPDDVELGCSGTLLRHIDMGYRVGLLDLTLGELGTRGNAEIRSAEALEASRKMGALFRWQLNLGDGFLMPDDITLRAVITRVRACRPQIILANAPSDRHPDHGIAADIARRASFLSGLPKIQTLDPVSQIMQDAWRPKALYHYIQDEWMQPDFVVNITKWFHQKLDLVQTFRSQFYDAHSPETETPISRPDFLPFLEGRARNMGRPAGFTYAEGFTTARYPGVGDLMMLD